MKPSRSCHRLPAAFVALLALASSGGAGVLVVAPTLQPGVDYTSLQAAVTAAGEGDTILVRDGTYGGFTIDAKSLAVVADGSAVQVQVTTGGTSTPTMRVSNLGVGQEVVVRGIRTNFGVSVSNCSGSVWFDQVFVAGAASTAQCQFTSNPGASVTGSTSVTFTGCTLRGEVGNTNAFISYGSSRGMHVVGSAVQAIDTRIEGGDGGDASFLAEQPGAAGLGLDDSTVTIVGCAIEGGAGGLAFGPLCTTTHAVGGPGVLFDGSGATILSAESTAVGGAADLEPLCPGQTGPAGPAISGAGTIVALYGYARHLEANSPVRGGQTLTFDVEGQPGETPLLLVSLDHRPFSLPSYSGALLVGLPPADMFLLPVLPASGQGSLSFPVPNVGGVVGGQTYYAQAVFLDPSPGVWLGGGTTVTLLDASY